MVTHDSTPNKHIASNQFHTGTMDIIWTDSGPDPLKKRREISSDNNKSKVFFAHVFTALRQIRLYTVYISVQMYRFGSDIYN